MNKLMNVFVFTFLAISLTAQVEVNEGTKTMREGSFNAYTVDLEQVSEKDAKSGWEKFMKEYKGKVSRDKKADIYVSENVQIPSLGSNPIDVYTAITENKNSASTTVSVWFDTGSGYVNSIDMGNQSEAAIKMVDEYATKVLRLHAEDMQKDQENTLKDMVKDSEKLENDNKKLREDIADAKSDILKWEKQLSQNEDDIKKKGKMIETQEDVVKEAKETARKF